MRSAKGQNGCSPSAGLCENAVSVVWIQWILKISMDFDGLIFDGTMSSDSELVGSHSQKRSMDHTKNRHVEGEAEIGRFLHEKQ